MRIKHNRSLISAEMLELVEHGYGSIAPSALCLEFLYLPDDPQDHETVLHPSPQERNKIMKAVMDELISDEINISGTDYKSITSRELTLNTKGLFPNKV